MALFVHGHIRLALTTVALGLCLFTTACTPRNTTSLSAAPNQHNSSAEVVWCTLQISIPVDGDLLVITPIYSADQAAQKPLPSIERSKNFSLGKSDGNGVRGIAVVGIIHVNRGATIKNANSAKVKLLAMLSDSEKSGNKKRATECLSMLEQLCSVYSKADDKQQAISLAQTCVDKVKQILGSQNYHPEHLLLTLKRLKNEPNNWRSPQDKPWHWRIFYSEMSWGGSSISGLLRQRGSTGTLSEGNYANENLTNYGGTTIMRNHGHCQYKVGRMGWI